MLHPAKASALPETVQRCSGFPALTSTLFLPFIDRAGNFKINIFSCLPAFCWVIFSSFEQTDKQAAA
jgi:hypothetical protein